MSSGPPARVATTGQDEDCAFLHVAGDLRRRLASDKPYAIVDAEVPRQLLQALVLAPIALVEAVPDNDELRIRSAFHEHVDRAQEDVEPLHLADSSDEE